MSRGGPAPAPTCPSGGARPTPPPTSSPMTASPWSKPAANSCCAAAPAADPAGSAPTADPRQAATFHCSQIREPLLLQQISSEARAPVAVSATRRPRRPARRHTGCRHRPPGRRSCRTAPQTTRAHPIRAPVPPVLSGRDQASPPLRRQPRARPQGPISATIPCHYGNYVVVYAASAPASRRCGQCVAQSQQFFRRDHGGIEKGGRRAAARLHLVLFSLLTGGPQSPDR